MEYSKYNHIMQLPGSNNWILYNFLSGGLIELDYENKKIFESILSNNRIDEIQTLLDNGFLTDNFDELSYLVFGNKVGCTDANLLSILIAPTMECNFACPYCFERHRPGKMSKDVQDQIVYFLENSLKEYHHKQVFIYWFGGEPLLASEIIESLSVRLIEVARKYGANYISAMSTNGFLLDQRTIKMLEESLIGRIQITLDGTKEIHDQTRILKNGEGTFDVIMSNLERANTKIRIMIRSNLHKKNYEDYKNLERYINEIQNENQIHVYAAHMDAYIHSDRSVDDLVLSIPEYSNHLKENNLFGNAKNLGLRFVFCDAGKLHSHCFDEKGNMYKCWNEVGDLEKSYCNVTEYNNKQPLINFNNLTPYVNKSFPNDSECISCKVLPLCMGGCIMKRIFASKKSCSPIKFNMDDYVYKKYLKTQGGDFGESGH